MAKPSVNAKTAESTNAKDRKSAAENKTRKGFWERYTDRLKNTRCTLTPPECR